MSRRDNCWDNAVAESFFSSLKKSGLKNGSTEPGNWRGLTFLITLKYSTIGNDDIVTSVA